VFRADAPLRAGRTIPGSIARARQQRGATRHPIARLDIHQHVRDAFVGSVTWAAPFVSFQMTQVSNAKEQIAVAARSRAPFTFSRIQRILLPKNTRHHSRSSPFNHRSV